MLKTRGSYKHPTGCTYTKEEWKEKVCNKLHMSLEYQKKVLGRYAKNYKRPGKVNLKIRWDRVEKGKATAREGRLITKEVIITAQQIKENLCLPVSITQIKSRINESNIYGRISRNRPCFSKVNALKRLNFAKEHYSKPISFWRSIIRSNEPKFELNSNKRKEYVWRRKGDTFKQTLITPTVKHGGGNIMIWGCFNDTEVGNLTIIDGRLTAAKYWVIKWKFISINWKIWSWQGLYVSTWWRPKTRNKNG